MEFDELKKIWDKQNNQPMYAINEPALRERIRSYKRSANRTANTNETGLILTSLVTGSILLFLAIANNSGLISYGSAASFFIIGAMVFWSRLQRKKSDSSYGQSMLEELDHAIANARYIVNFARTFVWWFLLPAAAFSLPNLAVSRAPWYAWMLMLGSFALSWFVVRVELLKVHLPRKNKLEALRAKLTEDSEEGIPEPD